MCGPNASCVNSTKNIFGDWNYHQCACNPGFMGNGIDCFEISTGIGYQLLYCYYLSMPLMHFLQFVGDVGAFFFISKGLFSAKKPILMELIVTLGDSSGFPFQSPLLILKPSVQLPWKKITLMR
jgi:hypothetical protein